MIVRLDAQHHNSGHHAPPAESQFAEILVLGQQQSAFSVRATYDFGVGRTGVAFHDIGHVVSRLSELPNKGCIDALVGQPEHN